MTSSDLRLLDQFAAAALTGFMARKPSTVIIKGVEIERYFDPQYISQAYDLAELMLKECERRYGVEC